MPVAVRHSGANALGTIGLGVFAPWWCGTRALPSAAMYAVVETGGKQYRVSRGSTLEVERLGEPGSEVSLRPVLVVDGDEVLATPDALAAASVTAVVVDEHSGAKIRGFTYKNKSNQRRRWGHRQTLATVEITDIRRD